MQLIYKFIKQIYKKKQTVLIKYLWTISKIYIAYIGIARYLIYGTLIEQAQILNESYQYDLFTKELKETINASKLVSSEISKLPITELLGQYQGFSGQRSKMVWDNSDPSAIQGIFHTLKLNKYHVRDDLMSKISKGPMSERFKKIAGFFTDESRIGPRTECQLYDSAQEFTNYLMWHTAMTHNISPENIGHNEYGNTIKAYIAAMHYFKPKELFQFYMSVIDSSEFDKFHKFIMSTKSCNLDPEKISNIAWCILKSHDYRRNAPTSKKISILKNLINQYERDIVFDLNYGHNSLISEYYKHAIDTNHLPGEHAKLTAIFPHSQIYIPYRIHETGKNNGRKVSVEQIYISDTSRDYFTKDYVKVFDYDVAIGNLENKISEILKKTRAVSTVTQQQVSDELIKNDDYLKNYFRHEIVKDYSDYARNLDYKYTLLKLFKSLLEGREMPSNNQNILAHLTRNLELCNIQNTQYLECNSEVAPARDIAAFKTYYLNNISRRVNYRIFINNLLTYIGEPDFVNYQLGQIYSRLAIGHNSLMSKRAYLIAAGFGATKDGHLMQALKGHCSPELNSEMVWYYDESGSGTNYNAAMQHAAATYVRARQKKLGANYDKTIMNHTPLEIAVAKNIARKKNRLNSEKVSALNRSNLKNKSFLLSLIYLAAIYYWSIHFRRRASWQCNNLAWNIYGYYRRYLGHMIPFDVTVACLTFVQILDNLVNFNIYTMAVMFGYYVIPKIPAIGTLTGLNVAYQYFAPILAAQKLFFIYQLYKLLTRLVLFNYARYRFVDGGVTAATRWFESINYWFSYVMPVFLILVTFINRIWLPRLLVDVIQDLAQNKNQNMWIVSEFIKYISHKFSAWGGFRGLDPLVHIQKLNGYILNRHVGVLNTLRYQNIVTNYGLEISGSLFIGMTLLFMAYPIIQDYLKFKPAFKDIPKISPKELHE